MNKVSIGQTVLRGYGFAGRRIVSNLGLIWLAAVFYAVAAGYWLHQFCTTMLVSPHPGGELNDFALFDLFCLVVVTALGNAIIARTLTGAALEPGGETMTAYFAVAKREWFMFLSLLRLYLLIVAGIFAAVFLGKSAIVAALPMIGANPQWQGFGVLPAMNAAVAIAALAGIAVLIVRLGFFAAPVASVEQSASLTRAWSLSRGNSWRLFVTVLGLSVPAVLLWAATQWALVGNDLVDALSAGAASSKFYQLIDGNVSVIVGAWTALLAILNMLCAGASARAYRAVRDNITEHQSHTAPILEPAFAGSFAGFAPRQAKEPGTSEAATAADAFPFKMMVAESPAVSASIEEGAPEPATEFQNSELAPHIEGMPEPLTLADKMHEAQAERHASEGATVMSFPPGAEHLVELTEARAEPHAEARDVIPLPSHGDETESSQQNAPSEAA